MLNNKLICRINFTVITFISVIHSFLKKTTTAHTKNQNIRIDQISV